MHLNNQNAFQQKQKRNKKRMELKSYRIQEYRGNDPSLYIPTDIKVWARHYTNGEQERVLPLYNTQNS